MMKVAITGMTCGHCVKAVTNAVSGVPGVEKVDVSLDRGEAVIEGSPNAERIVAAIKEEGYEAKVA